ncbi:hypothetical protein WPS_17040 [Vulcanimicrobium alpinum]|uniref:DUF4446 family protein n=1 Tax=Vulcanimicrobium alpinum TaxID=3016050 RepID=A0AAN1XY04_UNVUL|nr:DUF4446 family protein [Vulcanimicrobium alpinum]BDE06428.1 hypothetical protein WPS_17040 [Vulcanimicrobium alpinum]
MNELTTAVIASLTSALVVTSAYHLLVAAPRAARMRAIVDQHDGMLGGGATRATDRLTALERDAVEAARARDGQARRIESLEKMARTEVPRVGFVRFNAFDDVGSDLSYALALLNGEGDGVVLTSIYSREDTRTYGKGVTAFKPATDPSEEELAAIAKARAAAS